jgi:hypothetical protein
MKKETILNNQVLFEAHQCILEKIAVVRAVTSWVPE